MRSLSLETPKMAQAEILGDSVIFAVAGAFPQGFDWRFPIIDLLPQIDVFDVAQLLVDEPVDHVQLFKLAELLLAGQQMLPIIHALLALDPKVRTMPAPDD